MAKAKLTTRGISASTVTSDNLAKGSQLTHNQLDSNFINLRDQSFGIAADDSATIQVGAGDTIYIQGGTNVTTSTDSAGVVTINSTGEVTASSSTTFTNKTFDADGTGNSLTNIEVANLKSGVLDTDISSVSGSDDTLASAKAIKAYVDSTSAASGFKVAGDDSASVDIGTGGTLYVQGGTNVTTATDSAGVVTINAVSDVTGSSTTTFTNKTFDADATGNALSNVDVANLKSGVLDTDLSSASGSDDTLASAKAIKAYVDAVPVGDITSVVAGAGLTGGATTGDATLNVVGGTGITANANDIAIDSTVTTLAGSQELTNKTLTSAVLKTGVSGTAVLDEDDMSTNSDSQLATQQSIKAYTDAQDASQSLTIVCDDSTGNSLIFTPGTPAFAQFEGGNSITTSSLSTGNIKFELDTDIFANSVASLDSSEVEILNIRTDTLVAHDSTQITIRDALRVTGTITGTVTAAQYADLAEKYLADQEYAPGTVMIFGGDQEITQSTDTHDARIAGVVSTAPAFIMNNDLEGGTFLGLTGRVPCRVKGAIAKGDMVTSSDTPGVAQKLDPTNYNLGCVIGKALENYSGTGEGVIEVVVGRV